MLNGDDTLQLKIYKQKNNNLDLLSIDKLWEFEYDNIDYKALHINRRTSGNSFYLDVRAMPLFYWEFDKSIIHENHDGSHTANSAFQTIFADSGWNFVLVDFSPAKSWEGFGKGSTRKELFKRALEHYDYEFEIQGKTVYMRHMIGDDTNYMYKYKLNTSNISHATDASAMFTHIKGFGGFEQGEEDYLNNAELKREYTSPLADVVGVWEGKPIVDGRVTVTDTLDTMMQKAVEESLMITVEGTLHDVRQMGYETAVPLIGDRVFLMDERINLDQEIRVHSVKTTHDERDRVIACDVTFGSQSIRERRKASLNELSKNFADLITGKLKLPIISLEQIGKDMIKAIHDASSEIIFGDFGMMAISKTNPNHVFGLNSEGWYISQDGGATPRTIATAEGIYADALFAGTLWLTNEMNIESADGYLNISGSRFIMRSKTSQNNAVEITPNGVTIHGFDGREYFVDGIMRGSYVANIQQFNKSNELESDGNRWMYGAPQEYRAAYVLWDEYRGRYLNISGAAICRDGNPRSSQYINIRVIRALTGTTDVLYEERKLINHDEDDPSVYAFNCQIDLQSYFNVIPDYRDVNLYVQVKSLDTWSEAVLNFRVNRGRFYG